MWTGGDRLDVQDYLVRDPSGTQTRIRGALGTLATGQPAIVLGEHVGETLSPHGRLRLHVLDAQVVIVQADDGQIVWPEP